MDPVSNPSAQLGSEVWYLFLGGVAAGSYALAALASLFGREPERRASGVAHYLVLPLVAACGAIRLNLSGRHAQTGLTELAAFGAFGLGSFLGALADDGRLSRGPARLSGRLRTSRAGKAYSLAGAVAALAFGASTGRLSPKGWIGPAWSSALLLASAATTGVAAVVLLARRRYPDDGDESVTRLGPLNGLANVLELAVLAALAVSIRSPDGLAFMRAPGLLIPLFVVPVGLVLPLVLGESGGRSGEVDAALLTLFGGFVLCVAFVGIPRSLSLR